MSDLLFKDTEMSWSGVNGLQIFDQTNYTIDNKELFVINFPPACSAIHVVMTKEVYTMTCKWSKFCRRCEYADLYILFLIKIKKKSLNYKTMTDMFCISKQYVTFHCGQKFISIFNVVFFHKEFPCFVWLMLCHGGLFSKRIFLGSTSYYCSATSGLLHTSVYESVHRDSKGWLNFVCLYFMNYMNDLHNIWKRRS